MKSQTFWFVASVVSLWLWIATPHLEAKPSRTSEARLSQWIQQIEALQKQSDQILEEQNNTVADIKNLKIWVHKK